MGSVAPPGPSGSGNYLDSRVPSEEVLAREFVAMPDAIPGYEFIRDKIFEPEVQFASAGFLTKRDILKKVLELTEEEDRVRDELKRRGVKAFRILELHF